jgi:hypothetical protein
MPDLIPKRIVTANLTHNPALRAWREVYPGATEPHQIEVLKEKDKSAIYRLRGAGPGGASVIAKRCKTATALVEQRVYEEVLASLPMPSLRCYGSVKSDNEQFLWLFMQDAGIQPFVPANPEHRTLLARWLAAVHSAGRQASAARFLPQREPAHFLDHLRLGRARIDASRNNPALTNDDAKLLEGILRQGRSLEERWDLIEVLCQGMPRTFVHCDLKPKNMRVSSTDAGLALLCFDWEMAGWGLTGADLAKCPDLDQYREVVRTTWTELEGANFDLMVNLGVMFRMLAEIHWETAWLEHQWLERPRLNLRQCYRRVTEVMDILGMN